MPLIVTSPANVTIIRSNGTTATFAVTATGTGVLSYQWEVDVGSGFVQISAATSATLTLTNVTKVQDQHVYRCAVTDTNGTVYSNSAVLTVYNGPQLTMFPPTNANGVTTATLTCDYVTGVGEAIEVAVILPDGLLTTVCTTTTA